MNHTDSLDGPFHEGESNSRSGRETRKQTHGMHRAPDRKTPRLSAQGAMPFKRAGQTCAIAPTTAWILHEHVQEGVSGCNG